MPDSLQQRIMDRCVTRMKAIDGTGSFATALGTTIGDDGDPGPSVADSKTNWDESELPAISVFDADTIVPSPEAVDRRPDAIVTQRQLFRGFVQQGTGAREIRKLINDIYAAIRTDTQWKEGTTPLVMQTRMVRHALVRHPENFQVEGCEVEVELQYRLDKFTS